MKLADLGLRAADEHDRDKIYPVYEHRRGVGPVFLAIITLGIVVAILTSMGG
jgi:hypothetical protein